MAYDVVYIDHGNYDADKNYVLLKEKVPHAFKLNEQPIKTSKAWHISSYANITNFDFTWTPNIHKQSFNHCAVNHYGYADSGIALINKNDILQTNLDIDNTFSINRIKLKHEIFYIDTGYFGNHINSKNPTGKKKYHRIAYNGFQCTSIKNKVKVSKESLC